MRKIVTFLGKYPKLTDYVFEDEVYAGRVFAEALREFVDFDEMLVFTTEEARETTWPVLAALEDPRIRCVDIPVGHDVPELWQLFTCLTQEVAPHDVVIFDITHGLRSIPFLVFLAAAYLKEALNVTIEKIYYGAFELGPPAPVIDLSEFVELLDWLTATNQFVHTGNGRYLAHLLKQRAAFDHPPRRLTPEEQVECDATKRIRMAAGAITETSQALLTTLIPHVEHASRNLMVRLDEAALDLAQQAPPYKLLAERVKATYAPLAQENPLADDLEKDLHIQREMIGWYLDRNHLPQALTLMREWMVTAVGYRLGLRAPEILDFKGERGEIERALGWAGATQRNPALLSRPRSPWAEQLQTLPEFDDLRQFWNELTDWRNLVDHGAMRKNWSQYPVETVVKKGDALYQTLKALAESLLEEPCSS